MLRKVFSWLAEGIVNAPSRLSMVGGVIAICLITLFVASEVIAREVFNISLMFTVEWTAYMVALVGIGGAAYTMKHEGHVRADIILRLLPKRAKELFIIFGNFLGLIILITVSIQTLDLALISINNGYISHYPTKTPIGYVQLIIPIGLWLWALQVVICIIRQCIIFLTPKKEERS